MPNYIVCSSNRWCFCFFSADYIAPLNLVIDDSFVVVLLLLFFLLRFFLLFSTLLSLGRRGWSLWRSSGQFEDSSCGPGCCDDRDNPTGRRPEESDRRRRLGPQVLPPPPSVSVRRGVFVVVGIGRTQFTFTSYCYDINAYWWRHGSEVESAAVAEINLATSATNASCRGRRRLPTDANWMGEITPEIGR